MARTISHDLTVIIPAYNEAETITDTILSIQEQTVKPKHIIVVDDYSTDKTGAIAKRLGVTVIRPPRNTGSKAGAQNFALQQVTSDLTMAIDADTTLANDAIAKLMTAFTSASVAAACGFVIPRHVKTIWERGRYIEYLLAFTFYKPIQDHIGKPLISSGCFSMYKTSFLKENGGWLERTMAEDMDLTWSFHKKKFIVRFIPEAICYPIEPTNYYFLSKQLKRWSHGFVQNIQLHWKDVLQIPYLNTIVAVSTWDALMGALLYVIILPLVTLWFRNPIILLAYVIDLPVTLVPVLYTGIRKREGVRVLFSFPSFVVIRILNSVFILEAFWSELVMRKRLMYYEKGH